MNESPPMGSSDRSWNARPVVFSLLFIVSLVILFQALRLGLILRNWDSARGATAAQILSSFLYGLRFDLAIACYITLPIVVLAHLPIIGLRFSHRVRQTVFAILVTVMCVLIFLLLAEYEF